VSIQPITTTTTNTADRRWLASPHGTETNRTVTLDLSKFTQNIHWTAGSGVLQPYSILKSGIPLARITESGLYAPYVGLSNEVQTVTITGAPTGGTFTLTYSGQTTAGIAYNATAAAVKAALEALSNIAAGDVTVTGTGPYTVTFVKNLAGKDVAAMTASGTGLTGGTTPSATIATSTAGGAAAASDGTQIHAGFLEAETSFTPGATKAAVALRVHGQVNISYLPIAGFTPPAAGSTTALIHYIY
jgi:hypothetical protein